MNNYDNDDNRHYIPIMIIAIIMIVIPLQEASMIGR